MKGKITIFQLFKIVLLGYDYKNHAMHLTEMPRQGQAVGTYPYCTEEYDILDYM